MKTTEIATIFTALCGLLIFISGCAPKVIETMPPIKPSKVPYKQLPQQAKIPRTQIPYKIMGKSYYPIPSAYGYTKTGVASWYGKKFHGRKTSNGETYDMYAETAAHKTLPMHTRLLVENLENGKKTFVRVNDRGPFVKSRIIDLSYTAAQHIDMTKHGTAKVKITALGEAVKSQHGGKNVEHFKPYQDFNIGEFFIQIGAFTQKNNAERLKDLMLSQGRKSVIQVLDDNNKTFYRVQVRGGSTLDAASNMEKKLERSYPGAFVIAR
jgi:rare lipoprotein A